MILLTFGKFSLNLSILTFVFQESFFSALLVSFTEFCWFLMLSYTVSFQIFILRRFLIMTNNKSYLKYPEACDLCTKGSLHRLCNGERVNGKVQKKSYLRKPNFRRKMLLQVPCRAGLSWMQGSLTVSSLLADGALLDRYSLGQGELFCIASNFTRAGEMDTSSW